MLVALGEQVSVDLGASSYIAPDRTQPLHACRSSPAGDGDVTGLSRMEQSVEVVGGPSQLVQTISLDLGRRCA
jgi:hypothetical protein